MRDSKFHRLKVVRDQVPKTFNPVGRCRPGRTFQADGVAAKSEFSSIDGTGCGFMRRSDWDLAQIAEGVRGCESDDVAPALPLQVRDQFARRIYAAENVQFEGALSLLEVAARKPFGRRAAGIGDADIEAS